MNHKQSVILIIDDEQSVRKSIRAYLEGHNYAVLETASGRDGLALCVGGHIDLVLLDVGMPGLSGLDVLRKLRNRIPLLPVLMISGKKDLEEALDSMRLGARDYLTKPLGDMTLLRNSIERALEYVRLACETKNYREMLESRVAEQTKELTVANERLRKVLESARKFIGCTHAEKDAHLILQEFLGHMRSSGATYYRVEKNSLHLIGALNLEKPPELEIFFPLNKDCVFKRAIDSKSTAIVERCASFAHNSPQCPEYVKKSIAVFPLLDQRGEVGSLIALFDKRRIDGSFVPFNSQDREIGAILASCASEALRTACVVDALQTSEELVLKSQKRDAIGVLASGIAHDFNNILSAILGYTDLSLCSETCSKEVQANLRQVQKAGKRARDLVLQILSLSRADCSQKENVELSPVILEALDFVRASVPSSIAISKRIGTDLGHVVASQDRIHQIVMNLCTNAAQAMGSTGGVIKVSYTKVTDLLEEPFELAELTGGEYVRLMVGDNGSGIQENFLERIFDPYFTTKKQGEGTGLGLAVVQGIVTNLAGTVRVQSEFRRGSAFYVYLPVADTEHDVVQEPLVKEAVVVKGNERILFVDDEETLAEMAEQMLEHLGYRSRIFTSSIEALADFERDPSQYELVITDLTMPQMSGVELSGRITALRPDIPVILHTGYSTKIDASEARAAGIQSFMIKPLSMAKLSRLVRDVLDGK